jgi:hypothetical protein
MTFALLVVCASSILLAFASFVFMLSRMPS